jgi:hypothetical protein
MVRRSPGTAFSRLALARYDERCTHDQDSKRWTLTLHDDPLARDRLSNEGHRAKRGSEPRSCCVAGDGYSNFLPPPTGSWFR